MKVYELDFIKKADLHKLGKYADMSVDEYIRWFEKKKEDGQKVNKPFVKIYDALIEKSEDLLAITISEVEEGDDDTTLSFPAHMDKDAGVFGNLKKAFLEIAEVLSERTGNRKYDQTMRYASVPDETFSLELVAKILKSVYGENHSIKETSDKLGYVTEHIRNIHAKTIIALQSGDTICNNLNLNTDLLEWVQILRTEYLLRPESDLIHATGENDEQVFSALGYDFVDIGRTGVRFIIPKGTKGLYTKVVNALIAVLRNSVLPLDKTDIIEKIEQQLTMKKVGYYDDRIIDNILSCVDLIEADEHGIWLKTQYLSTDEQKLARIIYEVQPISSKEAKKKFEAIYRYTPTTGLNMLDKFGLKNIHGNVWSFSAKELAPIQSFVNHFAEDRIIFYYSDLEKELQNAGYVIPASIRSYITKVCLVDNSDCMHFCHKSFSDDYPEYNWRSQSRDGLTNWLLNRIKDGMGENDEIELEKMLEYIQKAAKDSEYERYIRQRAQFVIKEYSGPGEPFILIDKILKKNVAIFDSIDFSIIGLKGGKYPFFTQIRSVILNALKKAKDGRILLTDAIQLVNESIDESQDRNTIIRALTSKRLPEINVILQKIDGNLYVVKSGEEIAPEPIFEVKSSLDIETTDSIEEIKAPEERPTISYRLTFDWNDLETAMKRELKFYGKFMSYDHIDFNDAVCKFVDFVKKAENRNLNSRLPQYLYEYWYAKTDFHDRETYVSQLAIFFESLLSEIRYNKDGIRIRKSGLGDWLKDFGLAYVLTLPPMMAKGFERIYKDLYSKRNRFAHGEAVEMTASETAKTISDFVSLYIFTVAKYA